MLAIKLVLVVAIHTLGSLHANWHHTPNPQLGAAQSTQDGDPKATRNPLEMTFVISHRKASRTPHNDHDWSRRQSLTSARRSSLHQGV
jgi:hypothetical protein